MKKWITITAIIAVVALVFVGISFFGNKEFAGGTGTKGDPYLVSTAKQLNNVRNYMDKNFKQINDIDLSDYENWEPIGNYNLEIKLGNGFMGTYDGNGYTIKNLKINKPEKESLGLFGYIGSSKQKNQIGKIQNLKIENAEIKGKRLIGIVAGVSSGKIENVHVIGKLEGKEMIGGITGLNYYSSVEIPTIKKSSSDIEIKNGEATGGIAGVNAGIIKESKSKVKIESKDYVGGIAGINMNIIENTYATGKASSEGTLGGLVGENQEGSNLINSYTIVFLSGKETIGSTVGLNQGEMYGAYYDYSKSGNYNHSSGIAKTTEKMKEKKTYLQYSKWDFENIWGIEEGKTYPYLKWEMK